MLRSLPALPLALLLGACEPGTAPGGAEALPLSFSVLATPARVSSFGMNGLEVHKVQFVMAEVVLELQNEVEGCNDDAATHEEFTSGPMLVDLPVNGGLVRPIATAIPEGVYGEMELEVKAPDEDGAGYAAFRTAHPGWPSDSSVRVTGLHDGEPLDITLDVDVELEMEFSPPLLIYAGSDPLNVTVAVNIGEWFRAADGSTIDPRRMDRHHRRQVEDNIERSFRAFSDQNQNGEDDTGEDDQGGGDRRDD